MHKPPLPHRKNYTGPKIRGEYSGSGNLKRCVGEMGRIGQHGTPFITNILNDKLPTNFRPVTFQYACLTNPWITFAVLITWPCCNSSLRVSNVCCSQQPSLDQLNSGPSSYPQTRSKLMSSSARHS